MNARNQRIGEIAGKQARTQIQRDRGKEIYRLDLPQDEIRHFKDGYQITLQDPPGTLYITDERNNGRTEKEAWFISE